MYCPKCGDQIQDGFEYCMKCGTKIKINQEINVINNEQIAIQKKSHKLKIILPVVSALCIILFIFLYNTVFNKNNSDCFLGIPWGITEEELEEKKDIFDDFKEYKDKESGRHGFATEIKNFEGQEGVTATSAFLFNVVDGLHTVTTFFSLDTHELYQNEDILVKKMIEKYTDLYGESDFDDSNTWTWKTSNSTIELKYFGDEDEDNLIVLQYKKRE